MCGEHTPPILAQVLSWWKSPNLEECHIKWTAQPPFNPFFLAANQLFFGGIHLACQSSPSLKQYFTIVCSPNIQYELTVLRRDATTPAHQQSITPSIPDMNICRTLDLKTIRFRWILDDLPIQADSKTAAFPGDSRLGLLANSGAGFDSAAEQQEFAARKEKMLHLRCPKMKHQK